MSARRPVVAVAGWLLGHRHMASLCRRLAGDRPVTPVELPGGEGQPGGAWTPASLADRLAGDLAGPALWIGWSLGGQVVLEAARRHPDRVTGGLMIAATPCFCRRPGWPHGRPAGEIRAMRARLAREPRALAADFGALVGESAALPPRLPAPRRAALDAGLAALAENDYRDALPEVARAVHWVVGDTDPLVPPAAAEAAAARMPAARAAILAGAGHVPFASHGDELLAAVERLDEETE